ncbi:MAG: arylsulfatase [Candidatus Scalindua sp. AMX11]|nr:MAG: arylsulfatase [Candidatus Scalindua sp.]NOG85913.1 arylsulfatase [Planctomycetota bacterium]RZV96918.1 MAG: arylsulfatase [Candidatus Scalindua sp. SCAELEC01]TDE66471.1 MAG: arylsulfatase [Candidatus Scalindua sp. AMX11]
MKKITYTLIALVLLSSASFASSNQKTDTSIVTNSIDRTILPIKEPTPPTFTELDVRNAKLPPRFEVKAPEGAPNVLLVLIDDLGFAGTSTFGGPVPTPTFDKVASEGLYFNNFHTTAVCSPTRTALKSGRNHHVGNMGSIIETGTGFPGNTGKIPQNVTPVAEMLRLNGYSTAAFGKWHELAAWEANVSGPFDRWPTRQGFDKFYGFLGGETNQWAPFIYDGVHPVELPDDPNYHFMEDMTDQATAWIKYQKALTPDKPFFMYFAPGATHAPHHVPQSYINKWKGKFDGGWDAMREQILARQIEMGITPKGTKLAPKPEAIQEWESLSADEKRLYAKQAEVFAAFLEMTDYEVGRLIDAIDEIGQTENTMVIFVYGDNGTSAEGGTSGMYSEMTYFNGVQETVPDMLKKIDEWGGPHTYPHMAAGWAVMFDTPYKWTKQMGSDHGGTKVGMAVRWPKGIKTKGELRTQFTHVIDVAPTILEAIGLPEPTEVNGVAQRPMDGTSMLYTFKETNAKERHTTQYFEMFGNRAMYHDGWYARTIHRAPWEKTPRRPLTEDIWELYEVANDFSLVNDLSAEHPEKLKELQALFMKVAEENHVLPIDDRVFERIIAANVGRPDIMAGRSSLTLAEGMTGMTENTFLNIKNKSVVITAEIKVKEGASSNGIIIAQGGRFGGWALYVKDGVPAYDYNFLGMERYTVKASEKLKPGKYTIKFDFAYDGGGIGKGGMGTFYINDTKSGEGRIERTQPAIFSADETADVGIDLSTPVVETIGAEHKSKFNGHILKVVVEVL